VFEPRYLSMVADARKGEGLLALATLLPGWEDDAGGAPRFHPLATVGRIERVEELADGRLNLVLGGLERARLEEEFTSLPYRTAHARVEPDRPVDEADPELVAIKERLLAAWVYLEQLVHGAGRPRVIRTERVTFEHAVHALFQVLELPLNEKLMALEAEGPVARVPYAQQALARSLEAALAARGLPGLFPGPYEGN
jgi:Lon protease-like protein